MKTYTLGWIVISVLLSYQMMYSQCAMGTTEITIDFSGTGVFPDEIEWALYEDCGGIPVLIAGAICGTFIGDGASDDVTLCVTDGCLLTFEAWDDWGDGWNDEAVAIYISEDGTGGNICAGTQDGCILYLNLGPNNEIAGDEALACTSLDLEDSFNFMTGTSQVTPGCTEIFGCTDASNCRFVACANVDDGSCVEDPTCNTCPDIACAGVKYNNFEETPQGGGLGDDCEDSGLELEGCPITPADGLVDLPNVCIDFSVSTNFGNSCADFLSGYSLLANINCAFSEASLNLFDSQCNAIAPDGGLDPFFGLFPVWTPAILNVGDTYTMCFDFSDVESGDGVDDCIPFSYCTAIYEELCDQPAQATFPYGNQEEGVTCTTGAAGDSSAETDGPIGLECEGFLGSGNDEQWWSFTACSATGTIDVTGDNSYDAVIFLYDELPSCQTCPAPDPLDCADGTLDAGTETINFSGLTPGQEYYVRTYDWDAGDGDTYTICIYGATAGACTVIPVQLLDLKGTVLRDHNLIEWSTATELKTQWHVVEKSKDGFEWTELGRLGGQSSSTHLQSYHMKDYDPYKNTYYRLTSIDYNGHKEHSHSILLERFEETKIQVNPNPFTHNIYFKFTQHSTREIDLTIYDLTGRIVYQITKLLYDGEQEIELDLSFLSSGIYYVKIDQGETPEMMNIIKQ